MNERTIRALEFNKILERVKSYAMSEKTKSKISPKLFATSVIEVKENLAETDDILTILRHQNLEMAGISDMKVYVKRAQIGSVLTVDEFLKIKSNLYRKDTLNRVIESFKENEIELQSIERYTSQLPEDKSLYKEITSTIDESGVLDHASNELLKIRRQITREESSIRTRLNDILRKSSKHLSDSIITMRNNRFVLPVKADSQSSVRGIVHDVSATGQTVYIEPMAIVELSNKIARLREQENVEVEKILVELTERVVLEAESLILIDDILHHLDLVHAKAKYGNAINGTIPIISEDEELHLTKAYHPLIDIDEVVKNDIHIGDLSVIITGPNTGGKTVTIKTIGLCAALAQSGIPIPALDGSRLPVFDSIYADIGDEQSIEQSLSTFSSHLTNISHILDVATKDSLVILDELGAGTDPEEGAALAISILEFLLDKNIKTIATTHYKELKSFSYSREDVINASMEFDVDTLSPTYRLMIGIPGKSNAFKISEKLKLNSSVIRRAEELSGRDNFEINEMIESLERHTKSARIHEEETYQLLKETKDIHKTLNGFMADYEYQKTRLIEVAEDKANTIIKDAERKASEIIEELELMKSLGVDNIESHKLIEAKKALTDSYYEKDIKKEVTSEDNTELHVGDSVDVLSYGQKGDVIEVDGDEVTVQMGIIKMKIPRNELKKRKEKKVKPVISRKVSRQSVPNKLDLRGERYEDAVIRLDRYIDQVVLSNLNEVEIIHGKGTGALKEAVEKTLRRHSKVKSFRQGLPSEGGFGVTIVTMK
ncbi:endonuclease MutS2 [Nosocomiicoccus massiliensis]|uniref:Endonuclease MutS2 n=1 Tax=Nosocomiicoccus massiliensis TaxID=1232430 RepID=A0AAF1BN51_9STAP|nr:endonuclease MutS2 [Nosocomiicoccus massiliensis]WOS96634.1 endonuclease MutS2 [Nosocomiicoccus massiliensis]